MLPTHQLRLSELSHKINDAINHRFGGHTFWVIADITNHTFKPQQQYHYFELVEKDPDSNGLLAKVAGKAWNKGAAKIAAFEKITGQRFTNNINVLVNVSVEFHAVYGLQLSIHDVDTSFTLGILEQQRQATLARLLQENPEVINRDGDRYSTRNNRLSLNRVIQKIAIISSRTSAGSEDFRHTLQHNPFGYTFFIDDYFTAVQGDNAEQFLARMIEVFKSGKSYDALIITRGGGAQTDFLIFDNYGIGRAIAKFPIPVITGIGHQKNETIADLMAHTSTKTPTKAAEFIIAHNRAYEDSMLQLQKMIVIRSQQLFSIHMQSLTRMNTILVNKTRDILTQHKDRLVLINQVAINTSKSILYGHRNSLSAIASQLLSKPKIILYNRINDVKNTAGNLQSFSLLFLKNQRGYLGHYASVIRMMSPANILNKGFAIVKANDKITSNPDDISEGSDIDIILMNTQIKTTVKQKKQYDGTDFNV